MTLYVINLISNAHGQHEVHQYGCPVFPHYYNEIGLYDTCCQAVDMVKEKHATVICCSECNPICAKQQEDIKAIKDISPVDSTS